jgi:catechol 2,3-dioxygenase-like lactoylglutathione lyase family enzyme
MHTNADTPVLDSVDHVAIAVGDIASAVDWYTRTLRCRVSYQDATWAMLEFANIRVALVIAEQHPPHLAFVSRDAERFGPLKPHRDGTRSCYVEDPAGNSIEVLAPY